MRAQVTRRAGRALRRPGAMPDPIQQAPRRAAVMVTAMRLDTSSEASGSNVSMQQPDNDPLETSVRFLILGA